MSGMYPNNQSLEIFGEQVQWPGVGQDGKFTNGSFEDPMVKPSFIPAETINLILDNLSALVVKCGGVPDSVGGGQLAALATHLASANRLILRDEHGRAKVAAPVAEDDIARLADVSAAVGEIAESGALAACCTSPVRDHQKEYYLIKSPYERTICQCRPGYPLIVSGGFAGMDARKPSGSFYH